MPSLITLATVLPYVCHMLQPNNLISLPLVSKQFAKIVRDARRAVEATLNTVQASQLHNPDPQLWLYQIPVLSLTVMQHTRDQHAWQPITMLPGLLHRLQMIGTGFHIILHDPSRYLRLQRLELQGANSHVSMDAHVASGISRLTNLTHLDITNCAVVHEESDLEGYCSDDELFVLLDSFATGCPLSRPRHPCAPLLSLQHLSLSMGGSPDLPIFKVEPEVLPTSITHLALGGSFWLASPLVPWHTQLRTLHYRALADQPSHDGWHHVMHALPHLQCLESLAMQWGRALQLPSTLTGLHLWQHAKDASVARLPSLPKLRHLHLSDMCVAITATLPKLQRLSVNYVCMYHQLPLQELHMQQGDNVIKHQPKQPDKRYSNTKLQKNSQPGQACDGLVTGRPSMTRRNSSIGSVLNRLTSLVMTGRRPATIVDPTLALLWADSDSQVVNMLRQAPHLQHFCCGRTSADWPSAPDSSALQQQWQRVIQSATPVQALHHTAAHLRTLELHLLLAPHKNRRDAMLRHLQWLLDAAVMLDTVHLTFEVSDRVLDDTAMLLPYPKGSHVRQVMLRCSQHAAVLWPVGYWDSADALLDFSLDVPNGCGTVLLDVDKNTMLLVCTSAQELWAIMRSLPGCSIKLEDVQQLQQCAFELAAAPPCPALVWQLMQQNVTVMAWVRGQAALRWLAKTSFKCSRPDSWHHCQTPVPANVYRWAAGDDWQRPRPSCRVYTCFASKADVLRYYYGQ